MAILSNSYILILTVMSILLLSVYGEQYKTKDEHLCPRISTVLCLKDVLLDMSNSAKEINDIAHTIKQHIENEPPQSSLTEYADHKMEQIRPHLPKSEYHYRFMNVDNNINRTGLINLIKEENYAYVYLYNSIKNILKIENVFGKSVDKSFKKILNNIQKNLLCNYRSILYTYSETWVSIDEINGIEISKTRKLNAPSFLHDTYSIIIIRLLNEWMKNVNDLVDNVESKLLRLEY